MASKKRKKNMNPIELAREERSINRAKKHKRRTSNERKPRRREWSPDEAAEVFERIMPLDENERRREVEHIASQLPAENDDAPASHEDNGLVVAVGAGIARVWGDDGHERLCSLRGSLQPELGFTNPVIVGDRVQVSPTDTAHGVVESVAPRRTYLARPDVDGSHSRQLIAANIDQLLIVQAWQDPPVWFEMIDRTVITAERAHITPIICINKADLAPSLHTVHTALAPYVDLGYTVHITSAKQEVGLDALRDQLAHGRITALAGLSGVGKSSLLSAIEPAFQLRTGAVSDYRRQGTHTTTQALMLPFAGGYVIDTPGVREFGLADMTRDGLLVHYPDILAAGINCRFANCTHIHEPDCAVREAVEAGTLSQTRYHSYTQILDSLPRA